MGLTSHTTVVVFVVLTLAMPVAGVFAWHRVRGHQALRVAQRLGLFAVAQLSAVMLVFLVVNDQYQFYLTWAELFGSTQSVGPIHLDPAGAAGLKHVAGPLPGAPAMHHKPYDSGPGRLIVTTMTGLTSGVRGMVIVRLPPEYDQPAYRDVRFPVIEVFSGYRGTPRTVLNAFGFVPALRAAARNGTLQPVITVIPMINVADPRDTECTDVPNGPRVETWLSTDIRRLITSRYRAESGPGSWAVMGFSTGGYCAAKLTLHHPELFHSAASLGGYFNAIQDNTTGDLWGGSQALRQESDLVWLAQNRALPPVSMLLFASRTDRSSYPSTQDFFNHVKPPLQVSEIIVPAGGHNPGPMRAALPEVLAWIGQQLTQPAPATGTPPATPAAP